MFIENQYSYKKIFSRKNIHDKHELLLVAIKNNIGLEYANLYNWDCTNIDFGYSSLFRANLRYADLTGANLQKCYTFGCDFTGAIFKNTIINWQRRELVAALLRQNAKTWQQKAISHFIQNESDCWNYFLRLRSPDRDWALDTLAKYVMPNDRAPKVLVRRIRKG